MSIYHKPGERPFVLPCSIFGGRSPLTGKPVGQRHRWGSVTCDFCGKYREDVLSRLAPADRTFGEAVRQ